MNNENNLNNGQNNMNSGFDPNTGLPVNNNQGVNQTNMNGGFDPNTGLLVNNNQGVNQTNMNSGFDPNTGLPVNNNQGVNQTNMNSGFDPNTGLPVNNNQGVNQTNMNSGFDPNTGLPVNNTTVNTNSTINTNTVPSNGKSNGFVDILKKYKFAILGVVAVIAIVAIAMNYGATKTLNCTIEQDSTGIKLTGNIDATFQNKQMTSAEMKFTYKLDDAYKAYKDTFLKTAEESFDKYKNQGADISVDSSSDTDIVVTAKFKQSSLEALITASSDEDEYEKAKSTFEKQGYTCK